MNLLSFYRPAFFSWFPRSFCMRTWFFFFRLNLLFLLASLCEPAHYLRGSAVLLNIKGVKNRDCLTDSAHAQFCFSLSDVIINVLTICCQIPVK